MTDATAAPAETTETPTDAAQQPPAEDPKAALNEALKKSGLKLKAKDREYVPRDIDDVLSKANRVFGLESELERFKSEKTEAQALKSWKAAIEADDENAATAAFDALSPRAQQNAAKWLQRKAAAYEQERQLPPEALEERRARMEAEQRLREYERREQETQERARREEQAKLLRDSHESVLKTAKSILDALKVDDAKAPRAKGALTPVVARHMRVAMLAEQETGVPVDAQEVLENARRDVVESFGAVAEGMDDDALFETLGEGVVKRLIKTHLRRVKGIKSQPAPTQRQEQPSRNEPKRGTPAFLR